MANATWYYAQSGERRGPISLEEIRALFSSGQLRREDLVARHVADHPGSADDGGRLRIGGLRGRAERQQKKCNEADHGLAEKDADYKD